MSTPVVLTVDAATVVRSNAQSVLGINLNYIRDADANRPGTRTLTTALKDLRAKWLRYPGGEKSDYTLWTTPPCPGPSPTSLGWYATVPGTRLPLDHYLAIARTVDATPYLVAGYDSVAHTGRTAAQWQADAAACVRYCNVAIRGPIVRYWEIGNENWNNKTITPAAMGQVVVEFAKAMKAVDPNIRLGTSGQSSAWWAALLPVAAPVLTFVNVSLYPCWQWGSYERLVQSPAPDLIAEVRTALHAIDTYAPAADRTRLSVIVSECNSIDWSQDGWPMTNTLGHALVAFETFGALLKQPRVTAAMLWTTRWMDDAEASTSQWYALGPSNEVRPIGRALQLWGQFLQPNLVKVTGETSTVKGYASRTNNSSTLTAWVVNRGLTAAPVVDLVLRSGVVYHQAEVYQLRGGGPDDAAPRWGKLYTATLTNNRLAGLTCPGVSITCVRCYT